MCEGENGSQLHVAHSTVASTWRLCITEAAVIAADVPSSAVMFYYIGLEFFKNPN